MSYGIDGLSSTLHQGLNLRNILLIMIASVYGFISKISAIYLTCNVKVFVKFFHILNSS
jgi:hypothetical protein